jgi:hypothetical protein
LVGTLSYQRCGAAVHQHVVLEAEGEQHGLLDPLVGDPVAVDLLGDAQAAGIELAEHVADGVADARRGGAGAQAGAVFPRLFDDLLEFGHDVGLKGKDRNR